MLITFDRLASLDLRWPPRTDQIVVFFSIIYIVFSCIALMVLLPFGCFHAASLLFNFNTKMVLAPKEARDRCFNNLQEFRQLFCMHSRFRKCGPPVAVSDDESMNLPDPVNGLVIVGPL